MIFADKLIQLRREKGYSQEQLADLLNVSRQSVGKWEAGQSMPELNKLITLADLYGTTIDYLVREDSQAGQENGRENNQGYGKDNHGYSLGYNVENPYRDRHYPYTYEYKSKKTLFGLPLVHIKYGYGINVAKGIIAIGNIAAGVISIGGIAFGGLCFSGLGFGLLVLAGGAFGVLAAGGLSVGIIAFGGFAFGVYTIGGMSVAAELAVGGYASAKTAIGEKATGSNILKITDTVTKPQIRDFILQHHPKIWRPILKLFSGFASFM